MILDPSNWAAHAAPGVTRANWTAVIAAAGRGTRLGFDKPKILYPVAGRPILEWLLHLLLPACETVVLVLSPDGRRDVEPELERLAPGRYRIAIQEVPTGMGHAVGIGAAVSTTPHTAVLWGDQVAIRDASLDAILRIHEGPLAPDLTIPTVLRPQPYIHFEREGGGAISGLRQAREGDAMPPDGESDTGFFCFRTQVLRDLLATPSITGATGNRTGEFNLLPVIPYAAQHGYRVVTPRLLDIEETVGINNSDDADHIEPYLRSRLPHE